MTDLRKTAHDLGAIPESPMGADEYSPPHVETWDTECAQTMEIPILTSADLVWGSTLTYDDNEGNA